MFWTVAELFREQVRVETGFGQATGKSGGVVEKFSVQLGPELHDAAG